MQLRSYRCIYPFGNVVLSAVVNLPKLGIGITGKFLHFYILYSIRAFPIKRQFFKLFTIYRDVNILLISTHIRRRTNKYEYSQSLLVKPLI